MNIALEIQQLLLFFIFIAPGFLFSRTYLPYRPIQYYKKTSLFEQTALSLIGSAIIHGVLFSVFAIIILPFLFALGSQATLAEYFDPSMPISQLPLTTLLTYTLISGLYLVLALIVARRAGVIFGKRSEGVNEWLTPIIGESPPGNPLFWQVILQGEALKKGVFPPNVTIRMRDGDTFKGQLNRLKLIGDEDDTVEIAITDVTHFTADNKESPYQLNDDIVLLNSKDILWISRVDR